MPWVPFRWLLTQTRRHALFPQLPRHLHTLGSTPVSISLVGTTPVSMPLVGSTPLGMSLLGSPAGTATEHEATDTEPTDEAVHLVR